LLVLCAASLAIAGPTAGLARPAVTQIEIRNASDRDLEIDLDHGLAPTVQVIDQAGTLAPVQPLFRSMDCLCPCASKGQCPCKSRRKPTKLARGKSLVAYMDGFARLESKAGGFCYRERKTTPGRYLIRACDRSSYACGTASVVLPTTDTVAIELRRKRKGPTCRSAKAVKLRAARQILAGAALAGVPAATLAACDARRVRCADKPLPASDGKRCRITARPQSGWWDVQVEPVSAPGAPRELAGTIDPLGIAGPAQVKVAGSTWGVSGGATVRIVGLESRRSHTHGGKPAMVGSARFRVYNHSKSPQPVRAVSGQWLRSGQCEPPAGKGKKLNIKSLTTAGPTGDKRRAMVPPGESELEVWFSPHRAYQGWCDRFAAEVHFDVAGRRVSARAEWLISRRNPLRRPSR
jgi:hypothetical protein